MDRLAKAAQLEDPNIFDFDGTYDLYKRPEEDKSQVVQKDAPKSRYVQNLKSTAAGKNPNSYPSKYSQNCGIPIL